ncbi:MAG: hypothetical protein MPJ78_18720 [Hyphomicrobiaceae bacterium]|nr:hypothetical protein [Hyphomicrobiaceae bacterium]
MKLIRTNKGAACAMLAGLFPVLLYILFSDWAGDRLSDGFRLGTFPVIYLLLSMLLIAVTLFDARRGDALEGFETFGLAGLIRVFVYFVVAVLFAFYQEKIGFIPCAFMLVATGAVEMRLRPWTVIFVYASAIALLLFALFYSLGFALKPIGAF